MPAKLKDQEYRGVIFGLIHAVFIGLFPIVISKGVAMIPPIIFAAISMLLASMVALIYALQQQKLADIKKRKSYPFLILVTLLNIVIPSIFLFIGATMTSNINVALFGLSEIIFTLFFTHFIGEKTTLFKMLGALGIFIGGIFIIYNGTKLTFNLGDFFIIISSLSYPFGNFFSKKAMHIVSPSVILFVRFLLGGLILLTIGSFVEPQADILKIVSAHWPLLIFNGLIIIGISKIMWYQSLKNLDITKAVSIAMTSPLFSLIVLIGFLHENFSNYQIVGIACMFLGIFFSIYRKSVSSSLTKYAQESPIEI